MNRFVENRAVEPDHVCVVVVEFGALGRLVRFKMVRGEMTVGHRMFVVVARLGLVHVRGRQRRRERQKRGDDTKGRHTSQGSTNHVWHY